MQDDFSLPATRVKILTVDMSHAEAGLWRQVFAGALSLESFDHASDLSPTNQDLIIVTATAIQGDATSEIVADLRGGQARLLVSLQAPQSETPASLQTWGLEGAIDLGVGEWYLSPSPAVRASGIVAEVAVYGHFIEVLPAPEAEISASISVGFRDRAAIVRYGDCTVIGLHPTQPSRGNESFGRLVRRAVLPPRSRSKSDFQVGIVGYGAYGGMGHYHGVAIKHTAGLTLGAIAEPNSDRRDLAQEEFAGIRTYRDGMELTQDPEIDLVVIATPPSTHFELATAAITAGKHVVLEKPMCLTTREADSLIDMAREHNVALSVHQNRRFDADFLALRELIDSGELGEVFNLETFVGGFEHPCRAWHSEETISGGAAYDWGSHHIDWILQLYGASPTELFVQSHKRVWNDITNLDQIRIRMAFQDGREAEFIQSDIAGVRRPKFYVQGTLGTAVAHYEPVVKSEVEFPFGFTRTEYHHAEAPVTFKVSLYRGPDSTQELLVGPRRTAPFSYHANLSDHLVFGDPLAVTAESVRPVIEVLEVAHHLSAQGDHYAKL